MQQQNYHHHHPQHHMQQHLQQQNHYAAMGNNANAGQEQYHVSGALSSHDEPYEIGTLGTQTTGQKTQQTVIRYESPSTNMPSDFVSHQMQMQQQFNHGDGQNQTYQYRDGHADNSSLRQVKKQIGSWKEGQSAEEVEAYLVNSQRKFVKYRLNIFVLNRCVLKIQHSWWRARQRRRIAAAQAEAKAAKMEAQRQHQERLVQQAVQQSQMMSNMQSFGGCQAVNEQVTSGGGRSSLTSTTSTRKNLQIKPVDYNEHQQHVSGSGELVFQQRRQVVDAGSAPIKQQQISTTSQFAVITEEQSSRQNGQQQNQNQSINGMQKWAQQQVAVAGIGSKHNEGTSGGKIVTTKTITQVQANQDLATTENHEMGKVKESDSQVNNNHQGTPSFKTTSQDEDNASQQYQLNNNKAFQFNQRTVNQQQANTSTANSRKSSYQSQTARRGSPPRKGAQPGMMATKETTQSTSSTRNLHQPRSGSTLMAATAASKSRAAEVQMRQGNGTQRTQFSSVQKQSGGVTTTTTTTITTTYTKNGQVIGMNKSKNQFGRQVMQQKPRTTSIQSSQSTSQIIKPEGETSSNQVALDSQQKTVTATSHVKAQSEAQQDTQQQAPNIDYAAYSQQRHIQNSSLTTITESRQTDGSSPICPQQFKVDQAQVDEANYYINEYVKQRGNNMKTTSSSEQQRQDKVVNTSKTPPQSAVLKKNEQPSTQQVLSRESSAQKLNAMMIVTESDLPQSQMNGFSGRNSLLTEKGETKDATNHPDQKLSSFSAKNQEDSTTQNQNITYSNQNLDYRDISKRQLSSGKVTPGQKSPRSTNLKPNTTKGDQNRDSMQIEVDQSRESYKMVKPYNGSDPTDAMLQQQNSQPAQSHLSERVVEQHWVKYQQEDQNRNNQRQQQAVVSGSHPHQAQHQFRQHQMHQTVQYNVKSSGKNSPKSIGSSSRHTTAEKVASHHFNNSQQQTIMAQNRQQQQQQKSGKSPLPSPSYQEDVSEMVNGPVVTTTTTKTTMTGPNMAERVAGQKWDQIQKQQLRHQQQQKQDKLMNPILSRQTQQQIQQTTIQNTINNGQTLSKSQYLSQSQAKLPSAQNTSNTGGIQALDMNQVKTNLAPNVQSYRQIQQPNLMTSDMHNQSTGAILNKTTVTEHDQHSIGTINYQGGAPNANTNDKIRSISALSARSTFSMEQKRVQRTQNLNEAQMAAHSFSRATERQSRKSSRERNNNQGSCINSITKVSKVRLSPGHLSSKQGTQKDAMSAADREAHLLRQEHSMRSLMMPTQSSRMKMRQKSTSRERSCGATTTMLVGDISNTYSSNRIMDGDRQTSRKGSAHNLGTTIEAKTKQSETSASGQKQGCFKKREVQSTKSAGKNHTSSQFIHTKNTNPRYGLQTTTHQQTTTVINRSFVNGKEVSANTTVTENQNQQNTSGGQTARNYFQTPRYATSTKVTEIRKNQQAGSTAQLTSRIKSPPQQQTPNRTRNSGFSNQTQQQFQTTSVNQQGRVVTTNTTTTTRMNKALSAVNKGSQSKESTSQQLIMQPQAEYTASKTSMTVNSGDSPSRKSLQAGGNNEQQTSQANLNQQTSQQHVLLQQQLSEDFSRPIQNKDIIMVEEVSDVAYPTQTAVQRKKLSNSMNVTSSKKKHEPIVSAKSVAAQSQLSVEKLGGLEQKSNMTSNNHSLQHSPDISQQKKSAGPGAGGVVTTTTTTYAFKGVPCASEQRAIKRQQKQLELNAKQTASENNTQSDQVQHQQPYLDQSSIISNTNQTMERTSSKRQFAFAQPPPANSASRTLLRSKQQKTAQAQVMRSPNHRQSENNSSSTTQNVQDAINKEQTLIQSEQQTRSKAIIDSGEKAAAMHAANSQIDTTSGNTLGHQRSQQEIQHQEMIIHRRPSQASSNTIVTTTSKNVQNRQNNAIESDPIAFNAHYSDVQSGKSTKELNSMTASAQESKHQIISQDPIQSSSQHKVSGRYQDESMIQSDYRQQNVQGINNEPNYVIQEMQLNQMTLGGPPQSITPPAIIQQKFTTVLETEYREDTKQHLLKCLNEDLQFSKIQKQFTRSFTVIKEVLQKHYQDLNAVFIYYSGQSHAYPAIAVEDFISFCEECGILSHQVINEKTLMRCFQETTVSTHNYKKTGEKSLFRYEFLEILVHISAYLYGKQPPRQQKTNQTIEQILDTTIIERILRNAQCVNRINFRRYLIANHKVCELLARNAQVLRASYDYYLQDQKDYVTLEECIGIQRRLQLDVPDQILGVVFAESLMTVIDTVRNPERMYQLQYSEFLYFLCKITEVHYTNTEYDACEFHTKFDNLLPDLLEPMGLQPQFSYGQSLITNNEDEISEQQRAYLTNSQTKQMQERLYSSCIESKEEESNNEIADEMDENLEYQPSELGTSHFGTKINTNNNSAINDLHDQDIQAWPQPSPIAYPQMQEMAINPMSPIIKAQQHPQHPAPQAPPKQIHKNPSAAAQSQAQVIERRSLGNRKTTTNLSSSASQQQIRPKKSIIMNHHRGGGGSTTQINKTTSSQRTGGGMTTTTTTTTYTIQGGVAKKNPVQNYQQRH